MITINEINKLISDLYTKYNFSQTDIKPFTQNSVAGDPITQFCIWFKEAKESGIAKPYEMVLTTANPEAKPSARMVLLKSISSDGFTFFSNYKSRKGKDLKENKNAALLFYWSEAGRQTRIEGTVIKIPSVESDAYFKSRAKESQISALVSSQSNIIRGRQELENKWVALQKKQKGEISRPSYWGGYKLKPTSFEFWQHRPHRLHDRISYTLQNKSWKIQHLAP